MHHHTRHRARKLAVQAIYQWQMTQDSIDQITSQFLTEVNPKKVDLNYFSEIVNGVAKYVIELDHQMQPVLDRAVSSLDMVELAVLRLALYELIHRLDVPYKVVINEALNLTKIFGSVDGFKYVNGVLDKLAKRLRSDETK